MLRLELPSTPECGTLVRALLMGIGSALAWEDELVDDLKTAVTEACNNVVLHAYGGAVGRLVLRVDVADEWIEVVVQDHGDGLHGVTASDDHLHVGMPVISSLAERAEFLSPPEGGTEVRMFFRDSSKNVARAQEHESGVRGGDERGPGQDRVSGMAESWTAEPLDTLVNDQWLVGGEVLGVISPASLLGPALGRIVRAVAAGNHFRLDRFANLRVLTDTLGAYARSAASGQRLMFALTAGHRRLEIALGPFRTGSGAALIGGLSSSVASSLRELTPSASSLRDLADEVTVEDGQRGEIVRLMIADPR